MKRQFLLLMWLSGCGVKNDARYCDPSLPCADPAFPFCDPVAHECEATGPEQPDLLVEIVPDLSVPNEVHDLSGADLTPIPDLTATPLVDMTPLLDMTPLVDMTPLLDLTPPPDLTPQCVTSTTCANPADPICDSVLQSCRPCNGSGDNAACALHGTGLICKTGSPNMGHCAACNTGADCPATAPICNADGTCRRCTAHSECLSGVCDLRAAATNGQCAGAGNILYVDNSAVCAGADGTAGKPYCQITDAVANLGGKPFVSVKPRAAHYHGLSFGGANVTAYFVGAPTTDAQPIVDGNGGNSHTVDALPANNVTLNLTFDGFNLSASDGNSNLYCDASGGNANSSVTITVRNSILTGGLRAVRAFVCNLTVSESTSINTTAEGAAFETGSTWDMHNCFITQSAGPGVRIESAGTFRFNTVSLNGVAGAGGAACNVATTLDASIISGNSHTIAGSGPGTQFSGTCTLTNVVTGSDSITSAGKLAGTPAFLSTGSPPNLHLDTGAGLAANTACCIDKVTANSKSIDFDGETRPKGLNDDVGADEAQ